MDPRRDNQPNRQNEKNPGRQNEQSPRRPEEQPGRSNEPGRPDKKSRDMKDMNR